MTQAEPIKAAFERIADKLERRRSAKLHTAVTKVRLREGLTCDIEEGRWKLIADMDERSGGSDRGPAPGLYGRAALGSCMAMCYALWAAKLGVAISGLEVEVQADFDARGMYGVADVPAGYAEVRCLVTVESAAPEDQIRRVLDEADAHSPYVDVFGRAQKVVRSLSIRPAR